MNSIATVKLSALNKRALLLVGKETILNKEDYLKERRMHMGKPVYTVVEYTAKLNAKQMIDNIIEVEAKNMHEDWNKEIKKQIKESDIKSLQTILNNILDRDNNICYSADKKVEIDI